MFELYGKYNKAKIFTDDIDENSITQIINFLNQPIAEGQKIRMMPDVHAGNACTIGTTMTIEDKVVPNLVGTDIGCGMEVVYLENDEIDLEKLDEVIHKYVPSGYSIRNSPHKFMNNVNLADLRCYTKLENVEQSFTYLGTLGGGNHFIEVNKTKDDEMVMVVHSGSRRIGKDVSEYYQNEALKVFKQNHNMAQIKELIYCEGNLFEDYLHDLDIMQNFALWNRKAIIETILNRTGLEARKSFTCIHNYIDLDKMILRKGAVSAKKNEELIIPINMRDGSILCTGKGNSDWNYSAPHGAGRLMSRRDAKSIITLEEFEKSMEGIYSSSVNSSNISEAPMAYKSLESILKNIQDSVKVNDIIKPVYNFKA